MTFAIVFTSQQSIWACADRRLVDFRGSGFTGDSGVKICSITSDDGVALLAYAGIGRTGKTEISQWALRTLRGHKAPLQTLLKHLCDMALAKLAPTAVKHHQSHVFLASAFRNGEPHVYYFELLEKPTVLHELKPKYGSDVMHQCAGTGARYAAIEKKKITRLKRLIRQHDRGLVSAKFIATELAAFNVAISKTGKDSGDNSISADCIVVNRNHRPKGTNLGGGQWNFDSFGVQRTDQRATCPDVSNGMPISDMADALSQLMLKKLQAIPAGTPPEKMFSGIAFEDGELEQLFTKIPDTPDSKFD